MLQSILVRKLLVRMIVVPVSAVDVLMQRNRVYYYADDACANTLKQSLDLEKRLGGCQPVPHDDYNRVDDRRDDRAVGEVERRRRIDDYVVVSARKSRQKPDHLVV